MNINIEDFVRKVLDAHSDEMNANAAAVPHSLQMICRDALVVALGYAVVQTIREKT